MPDKTVEFMFPSGLGSLTAKMFPDGSGSIANGAGGDTATEDGTRSGLYSFTVTQDITNGIHLVIVESGSTKIGHFFVNLLNVEGTYTGGELGIVDGIEDVYHADIDVVFNDDGVTPDDEYTVTWFKNGVVQTSGITDANIKVVKQETAANLIDETAMTEIGSTESFRYTATGSERMSAGKAYKVIATATIDGATRTWPENNGRDATT